VSSADVELIKRMYRAWNSGFVEYFLDHERALAALEMTDK